MIRARHRLPALLAVLALAASLMAAGCASTPEPVPVTKRPCPTSILALAPFQAAKQVETGDGVICPITGEIHAGYVVSGRALTAMNAELPPVVESFFSCRVVPPDALVTRLPVQPATVGRSIRQALADAGSQTGAEAVLAGSLFRYRERKGGNIGVEKAASVYFGMYLIDVRTAKVVWQGFFNETQASLSENVLNMGTFLKRGGKWLTVAELGRGGLYQVIQQMPSRMPE